MIWVTWRQHRGEAYVVCGALALLLTLLVVTGHNMVTVYQQLGVGDCIAHPDHPNCGMIVEAFTQQFSPLVTSIAWLNAIPALLGILVGAPLVARELELGTFRLVWTQSVTRLRWLIAKLGLVVGAALLATAALMVVLSWWFGPLHQFGGYYFPLTFDFEGAVPLAHAAFALALGIAAGTLLGKAIPAMATALAGFVAVRVPIAFWARPHYLPPITLTGDPSQVNAMVPKADWVLADGWVDRLGHPVHLSQVYDTCAPAQQHVDFQGAFTACTQTHGWQMFITYQPANRFLLFASIETMIFLSLAAGLVVLTIWWLRRRLA
jgi:hypothetical protein